MRTFRKSGDTAGQVCLLLSGAVEALALILRVRISALICGEFMKRSIKTTLDEQAYKRDGYSCVHCGGKTGLEAHHKIPDLERLDNLITLCHSCHKKEHGMSGCFVGGYDKRRKYKITKQDAILIKQMLTQGIHKKKIASQFGIHERSVCDIEKKVSWAWVQ